MNSSRLDYLPFADSRIESFCPAPFSQLVIYPSGKVTPCHMLKDYALGNIREETIEEIWNGSPIKKLREELLTGNNQLCHSCQEERQCQYLLERFVPYLTFNDNNPHQVFRLDLRLNSVCNLKCIMCTTWHDMKVGFHDDYDWDSFVSMLPQTLKEINLYGGEPFIQNSTNFLIEKYSKINPSCLWVFSTNLNFNMSHIENSLSKARIGMIHMSVDSLNEKNYKKIRCGGDYSLAFKNIDCLILFRQKYCQNKSESFRLLASLCVQKLNWREIPEFLHFCHEKNLEPWLQFVYDNKEHSILHMNSHEREQIISYLLDHTPEALYHYLYPVLRPLKMSLNK